MDNETLKALAGKISAMAILMDADSVGVCISKGTADEKTAKEFADFIDESLAAAARVRNHQQQKEKDSLGQELDSQLGEDEFKELGQDLAMVIANHHLTREPELCDKVFRYMSFVVQGWNSV